MFKKDTYVQHPGMPTWGIGKVLEDVVMDKARVFFIDAGEKLISLKSITLQQVASPKEFHPVLDNPSIYNRDKSKKFISLTQAKAEFLLLFPEGFHDKEYFREERDYKVVAHELMQSLLSKEQLSEMLSSADFAEVCRRSLQVVNKTNLIFPNEKMALKDGLKDDASKKLFAEDLFELLYGSATQQLRFERFAKTLDKIGAAKWTIISYFMFIAFPETEMFMKPTVSQHAAELCAFELNYKSELNWLTYKCLLQFSGYLKKELVKMELEPRDMIDVQSFMWCIRPGSYV
ncbi:MAG: DUF3553 domain-containing protein [Desulfuromonadaceae bacterium]|nr:DUF3553 domain-containing protein [Desulfuromonadaceae bacterium]MDD2854463.1 DUF3553 domain-containing protein [Desulfuromonadaceae bacterium]